MSAGTQQPAQADTADRKQTLDQQLNDLRETLEGTSKKLVDAAVALKKAQADLVDADAALKTAQAEEQAAQAEDDQVAAQLAVAQAALDKAAREFDARQLQEQSTLGRLGDIAREAYVGSRLSGLSIALDAQSPAQFADQVNAAGTALRTQNQTLAKLAVQQAETRARQSKLDAAKEAVEALKKQSEAILEQKQAAENKADAATRQIAELVAKEQAAITTISAKKAAEQRRVKNLQKQEAALAKILRTRARQHPSESYNKGSGKLSYPVNAPITSGFGYRYHPILHYRRLHAGTDFGAPCGTPVHAAAAGRVVRAGWVGGFGNQVLIDHGRMAGKSLATSYNHLSKIITRGGSVKRGQIIAYSGTTGLSTGCHLHFEVYVNGTHVNPMSWL